MSSPARVYHVSEIPGIEAFVPRPARDGRSLVWAIADERLHNYLLPRDCPRVTFYATDATTAADRDRFIPPGRSCVVAVALDWLDRILHTPLFVYAFDGSPFRLDDAIAGYWVSHQTVHPLDERAIADPLAEMLTRNVEFCAVEDLSALRAAVIESSLGFSIIRWDSLLRNR